VAGVYHLAKETLGIMNIKTPPVYDISHYKEVPDFSRISPFPLLMFTKATEAHPGSGYNDTDDKFVRFFAGMQANNILRGCYHFFRKAFSPTKQAAHFVDTIRPYLTTKDVLALDIEEGGETGSQIMEFLNYVGDKLVNLIMIYSRKNILDPIPMTNAQAARLKQYPIWTAGYPYFPDLYSTIPAGYTPNQNRWGKPWLWQYSSHGQVAGIVGDVDLNLIAPEFIDYLGEVVVPPPQDISYLIQYDKDGNQLARYNKVT
jgi:lysozyme